KGIFVCLFQKMNHICHVGRKSAERLFNTLFVTNICIDFLKYAKLRIIKCRNMKPGLSHKSEEAYCFQRDSLPACVRTGYYQKIKRFSQADINRHYLMLFDQRVPGFFQIDDSFGIKPGFCGILGLGKESPGKYKVKLYQKLQIILYQFQVFPGS